MSVYLDRVEEEYRNDPVVRDFLISEYEASPKWEKNAADRGADAANKFEKWDNLWIKTEQEYHCCEKIFKIAEISIIIAIILFIFFFETHIITRIILIIITILLVVGMEEYLYEVSIRLHHIDKNREASLYPEFASISKLAEMDDIKMTELSISADDIDLF